MASSSIGNITINHDDDDDNDNNPVSVSNESSFHSSVAPPGKRKREDGIRLKVLSGGHETISLATDSQTDDEEDQSLVKHYKDNRLKQERLLMISNIFRFVIVIILAPILYFTV